MTGRGKTDNDIRHNCAAACPPSVSEKMVCPSVAKGVSWVEALVCPVLAQKLMHNLEIPEETDNQEGSCLKSWLVPSRKFWSFTAVLPHVACPGKALGRRMKPC